MPSDIPKELYNKNTQVSTALTELKKSDLVTCINEKNKKKKNTKGRLYKTTEDGKILLKKIDELNIRI